MWRAARDDGAHLGDGPPGGLDRGDDVAVGLGDPQPQRDVQRREERPVLDEVDAGLGDRMPRCARREQLVVVQVLAGV